MDRNNDNTVKTQPSPEDGITVTDPVPGPVVNPPGRQSSNRTSRNRTKRGGGGTKSNK